MVIIFKDAKTLQKLPLSKVLKMLELFSIFPSLLIHNKKDKLTIFKQCLLVYRGNLSWVFAQCSI